MITLEQAKQLKPGAVLLHRRFTNSDGTPQRWRVNGAPKTWKRDPSRVRIPVKRGLWQYDYVDETVLSDFDLQ